MFCLNPLVREVIVVNSGYTSNLLCHFVGRSKNNDDELFELLKQIISGNTLIANLENPDKPESFFQLGYKCENVGEVFGKCDCVCFCDIPNQSLAIHINKYSRFGIGFKKTFIAEQGARPVMYVPKNYLVAERGDNGKGQSSTPREPEQYFPYILTLACNLLPLLQISSQPDSLAEVLRANGLLEHFNMFDKNITQAFFTKQHFPLTFSLIQGVANEMAYVKLYDATLPDEHPDNYYMEREWRSLNNVLFSINDIQCVYLPNNDYKEKFKECFPEYTGDFYLFE